MTGFSTAVRLNVKLQFTGKTVVLGLVPLNRKYLAEFDSALTNISVPFTIRNKSSPGRYAHVDGIEKGEIRQDDIDVIAGGILEAIKRLRTPLAIDPEAHVQTRAG